MHDKSSAVDTLNGRATLAAGTGTSLYYRHRLPVRIMHWINVICLTILFMSGLAIFNAHPALYWGDSSYSGSPAFLQIAAADAAEGKKGVLRLGRHEFETTGFLGVSRQKDGSVNAHAFPHWLTIPGYYSLASARSWHFFFAWLLVINGVTYVLYAILGGHVRRDLLPTTADLSGIGRSIKDHLLLKHPHGEAARHYNVLQKLAYLLVIFILLPLIILMGMAMSPMLDTVITGWVGWFGGRQSARSIHFILAWLLLAFVLVHVFEVIVSGFWNHLRSMITGYYRIPERRD
ncbi:cytochrome b/b6 domain-containing protein [Noviherbaspirillum massiliense]|uniref:cytochrome b/b6 domain-containing protein n=1 Tax=Noviherbaspirillum massiliense TaxID=1465823 RepID=UPI00031DE4D8|nr:cytochrome b/b6 domain-containing protein [Noviherbaspirillum massiliense]